MSVIKNLAIMVWMLYVTVACIAGMFNANNMSEFLAAFIVWMFVIVISAGFLE